MTKLPALQWYTGDWRKDPGVQSLDYFERGVWFEIINIMHESEERGRLVLAGNPMPDEALARLLGLDNQNLTKVLTKLLDYGVASRADDGTLICRRMIRDENLRQIRTESGKKGGNPSLVNQNPTKPPTKIQPKPETEVNQISTPSSSSSSSTSVKEKELSYESSQKKGSRIPDDFEVTPEMATWAKTECPGVGFTVETEKFRNYYLAKTGRDATKLDWPATWRNWILNARDRYGPSNGAHAPPRDADCSNCENTRRARYDFDTTSPCPDCRPVDYKAWLKSRGKI